MNDISSKREMPTLITTGDDAGMSRGINQAIADLAEQGQLTTTSIIANYDYLDDAATLLIPLNIATGAHLNITEGYPITIPDAKSGLVQPNGQFHGRPGVLWRGIRARSAFLTAVEAEFIAQIERIRSAGFAITHITSHMHWQVLPALQKIIQRLAKQYQCHWMRCHHLRRMIIPQNIVQTTAGPISQPDEVPYSLDYVTDARAWMSSYDPVAVAKRLAALCGKVEVVIHPSLADDPTYPGNTNFPVLRHQQMVYFTHLIKALREHHPTIQLADPAQN